MSIESVQSGKLARIFVVSGGVILLGLLFFADKTHLSNKSKPAIEGNSAASTAHDKGSGTMSAELPPLSPDKKLDEMREAVKQKTGKEKVTLLDSIISTLKERKRYDYAANYAEMRLTVDNSLEGIMLAGNLSHEATRLEHISQDSVLFRQYSDKTIDYFQKALQQDSLNEKVLLALGTAYIESRNPQNSMKGILSIRKVTEINPNNAEASFQLGMFSIQTGQFDKAEARLIKVLELQPKNELAKFQLANVKSQLGKTAEAKKLWEEVLAKTTDANLKEQIKNALKQ
jgi:tetratricopeptide (TPR) repeat protein